MKGTSEGWSSDDCDFLARYSARDVIAVVNWCRARIPYPASELVIASGGTPTRPATFSKPSVQSGSARMRALAAFADAALVPPFSFSRINHFYRDANGKFVPWVMVREVRDKVRGFSVSDARSLSSSVAEGRIAISEWQRAMADVLKMGHGATACLALGGWYDMNADDWRTVGDEVARQLKYLEGFARAMSDQEYRVDGSFYARADQYGNSAKVTWFRTLGKAVRALGYDMEMNMPSGAENCDDCLEETDKGWVPYGTLVDIGSRDCLNNCACEIEYRSSLTGDIWDEITY